MSHVFRPKPHSTRSANFALNDRPLAQVSETKLTEQYVLNKGSVNSLVSLTPLEFWT